MNGKRFVVVLAVVAVAAAVWIRSGVPGLPQAGAYDDGLSDTSGEHEGIRPPRPDAAASVGVGLVDSARVPSADTAGAWTYRSTLVADLDGDAVPERLILASDVYVTDDGEPMWEDGHRWAVYVEEDDGERTLVYAAFVPLGTVDAGVAVADSSSVRRIVILERGGTRARLLLAAYDGPGTTRRIGGTGADIQTWAGAGR